MQGGKTAQPALDAAVVKAKALALGFDLCGVARARPVDSARLDKWFSKGWHASLSYVSDRRAERLDPSLLVPGARSVIALAASYGPGPDDPQPIPGELLIARYARGRDYHNVILKPARKLAAWLREQGAKVYCEVDTGAVLEKHWAQEAGLGWIGKNGCLIHERFGSWLLLGALVTDLDLQPDPPHPDRCGECALCIPACPTQAIPEPRYVDARKCLAFHTIEHRNEIPRELAEKAGNRLFGCDACQDVCPWNRRAPPGQLVQLRAKTPSLAIEDVLSLTHEEARRRFEGTPILRAGRDGLVRTALAITEQAADVLAKFAVDDAPGVRAQAQARLDSSA
jgi:epoxyqueuosine reductase